jgi:hypothetical protein
MTDIHVHDESNHLLLTGFYLPRLRVFSLAHRDNGAAPLADEVGIARLVTACAKQLTEGLPGPSPYGLDTWVVKPGTGLLSAYFQDEGPTSRYRVMVHRSPARCNAVVLPLVWDAAYDWAEMDHALVRRAESLEALRQGADLLCRSLAAYRLEPQALCAYMHRLGHPVTHVPGY